MAEMNNYYFVNFFNPREVVNPKKFRGMISLAGNCIGREGFKDGNHIVTSTIIAIEDDMATTHSGTKYKLQDMNEDYMEYLLVMQEEIPIIHDWKLSGNRKKGYTIYGTTEKGEVEGKIISQQKNFITLENGTKFFVMWTDSVYLVSWLKSPGEFLDMNHPEDFEEFLGLPCRPILFK